MRWIGLIAGLAALPYWFSMKGSLGRVKKQCPIMVKEGTFFFLGTLKKAVHDNGAA